MAKKPKLSEAQKAQARLSRNQKKLVRGVFTKAGFSSVAQVRDAEFKFKHVTSDFDDCFVYENVIVLVEYTIASDDKVGEHLKNKQGVYNVIDQSRAEFIPFLKGKFPDLAAALPPEYLDHHLRVVILYCALNSVKAQHRELVPQVSFFDFHVIKYFETVSKATALSSRFELLDFLGLTYSDVGDAVLRATSQIALDTFNCSVLPEGHSNFGKGFKVVSFYASPAAILPRACVLRRYGWREGERAYQRLISVKKIQQIRRYLRASRRVFINNIVATLPEGAKIIDDKGDTVDPATILTTSPAKLQLPLIHNSVGLIDGQHRVYSYHEGGEHDQDFRIMRAQQNLLVTGIIFPPGMAEDVKLQFEAKLFLEINSNQATAKSDIKQEIASIIEPFSGDAICRRVMTKLNNSNGPLQDKFQRYGYERDAMKTSSVVSFALKPLVGPRGALWERAEQKLTEGIAASDVSYLEEYVTYCTTQINAIFSGVRQNVSSGNWTASRKISGHFLTTRNVNAILACLRKLAREDKLRTVDEYRMAFKEIEDFDSKNFGSSKYNAMGEALYKKFFT